MRLRRRGAVDVEPAGHAGVGAVAGDDRRRIERRPGGGIAPEQARNGLGLVSGVGRQIAGDVHESAEHVRMHHRQVDRARPAHRPPGDAPVRSVGRYAVVRNHERHNIFGEVIGGVSAGAVDTFGVVVERAAGVGEDEHRRVAPVRGREVVDRLDGPARPHPVGGSIELAADHHHGR